jgi:hypothetical protein
MGRLSNPPELVEMVTDQGSKHARRRRKGINTPPESVLVNAREIIDEETGQLSNPPPTTGAASLDRSRNR